MAKTESKNIMGPALELFMGRLGDKFYLDTSEQDRVTAFRILEKKRDAKGNHLTVHGSVTRRQAALIEQSSFSVEEVVQKFYQHIFEGIDTTAPIERAVAPAMKNEIDDLRRQIDLLKDELVKRRLDEIHMLEGDANEKPNPKPKAKKQPVDTSKIEGYDLWLARARKMNHPTDPVLNQNATKIDGRWLRNAENKWAASGLTDQ